MDDKRPYIGGHNLTIKTFSKYDSDQKSAYRDPVCTVRCSQVLFPFNVQCLSVGISTCWGCSNIEWQALNTTLCVTTSDPEAVVSVRL